MRAPTAERGILRNGVPFDPGCPRGRGKPIDSIAMTDAFQVGLDTFGDVTLGGAGTLRSHAQVLRDVVDEAALADEVGLDAFGVGEHHRPDFAISAPEVVLAAIASRTERILLGSAVTVLSTDDPVRVFERFSTLDGLSNGRAEVILGRGSFTESYPLFGYDLSEYEELFEDKLSLFAELLKGGPVTWRGSTRAPLSGTQIYPPVERGALKVWIGVGGSPESILRAARYGLPLTLAIIGGSPARFKSFVAGGGAFAGARRRHGRPGEERAVAALRDDDQPHRRRARMAAGLARAVRARGRTRRRAVRGIARNGGGKDHSHRRPARPLALQSQVQRRHAAALRVDDEHRADRPGGSPERPRGLSRGPDSGLRARRSRPADPA